MKYLPRLLKKLIPNTIINSKIHKTAKAESGSYLLNTTIGRYSYCGNNCKLLNTEIGAFCSIASNVEIGLGNHPMDWVSTSPAFYKGRDSISKRLAKIENNIKTKKTTIDNDVWIGERVIILSGIHIQTGAVIGTGSVVTKDVGPYEVVAGVPARCIKKRFSDETIDKLLATKWWELDESTLCGLSGFANSPELFCDAILELKNRK